MPHPSLRVFLDWLQKHSMKFSAVGSLTFPEVKKIRLRQCRHTTVVCEDGVQFGTGQSVLFHGVMTVLGCIFMTVLSTFWTALVMFWVASKKKH